MFTALAFTNDIQNREEDAPLEYSESGAFVVRLPDSVVLPRNEPVEHPISAVYSPHSLSDLSMDVLLPAVCAAAEGNLLTLLVSSDTSTSALTFIESCLVLKAVSYFFDVFSNKSSARSDIRYAVAVSHTFAIMPDGDGREVLLDGLRPEASSLVLERHPRLGLSVPVESIRRVFVQKEMEVAEILALASQTRANSRRYRKLSSEWTIHALTYGLGPSGWVTVRAGQLRFAAVSGLPADSYHLRNIAHSLRDGAPFTPLRGSVFAQLIAPAMFGVGAGTSRHCRGGLVVGNTENLLGLQHAMSLVTEIGMALPPGAEGAPHDWPDEPGPLRLPPQQQATSHVPPPPVGYFDATAYDLGQGQRFLEEWDKSQTEAMLRQSKGPFNGRDMSHLCQEFSQMEPSYQEGGNEPLTTSQLIEQQGRPADESPSPECEEFTAPTDQMMAALASMASCLEAEGEQLPNDSILPEMPDENIEREGISASMRGDQMTDVRRLQASLDAIRGRKEQKRESEDITPGERQRRQRALNAPLDYDEDGRPRSTLPSSSRRAGAPENGAPPEAIALHTLYLRLRKAYNEECAKTKEQKEKILEQVRYINRLTRKTSELELEITRLRSALKVAEEQRDKAQERARQWAATSRSMAPVSCSVSTAPTPQPKPKPQKPPVTGPEAILLSESRGAVRTERQQYQPSASSRDMSVAELSDDLVPEPLEHPPTQARAPRARYSQQSRSATKESDPFTRLLQQTKR